MNSAEILIKYNGFLLIFSATGFLVSLLWVLVHERRKRVALQKKLKKMDLFDEKIFFGEFDHLENPAKSTSSHKPSFDNVLTEEEELQLDYEKSQSPNRKNNKFENEIELPKFPTLKKELDQKLRNPRDEKLESLIKMDPLDDKPTKKSFAGGDEDEEQVKGLLDKIKKDLKNRKD